jgi:hypothetical protein
MIHSLTGHVTSVTDQNDPNQVYTVVFGIYYNFLLF